MMRSELRVLPAGFCCCIFIFESKNEIYAGEPGKRFTKYTGALNETEKRSISTVNKLKNDQNIINSCTYVYPCSRYRVKPVFFESLLYSRVYFIFGSSLFEAFLGILSEL